MKGGHIGRLEQQLPLAWSQKGAGKPALDWPATMQAGPLRALAAGRQLLRQLLHMGHSWHQMGCPLRLLWGSQLTQGHPLLCLQGPLQNYGPPKRI